MFTPLVFIMALVLIFVPFVLGLVFLLSLPLWKPKYDYSRFDGDVRYSYNNNGLRIAHYKRLAMLDWDIPAPGHKIEKCISVETRQEVVELCEAFVAKHPEYSITLETTPGGVRGWFNQQVSMTQWVQFAKELNCDKLYRKMVALQGVWACRISGKDRPADFVARPWMVVGLAPMSPSLLKVYQTYRLQVSKVDVNNVMTVGLPGSGKSTYARMIQETGAYYCISTDEVREELYGKVVLGDWQEVWSRVLWHVNQAKAAGLPVLLDACHPTVSIRANVISTIGGDWDVAWREADTDKYCEQQKNQERQVPEDYIYNMQSYFQPPSTDEKGIVRVSNI